jgi:hypothetical protein
MLKKYKQFYEGKTIKLRYSKEFYLKEFARSKNGKSGLFGFEIKDQKHQIWIPTKAIYHTWDNELPDLPEEYKKLTIAHFIYEPDSYDEIHDKRVKFFEAYEKYMSPVINKQNVKKTKIREKETEKRFLEAINRMVPDVDVQGYDSTNKTVKTNIGDFYVYNENPISFRIGDVSVTMKEDGVYLNYKGMTIKGVGKNGIIVKSMIKHNSGQKLNAVEKMALKRIYTDALKSHDWYYHMSDDHRSYKAGENSAKKISNIGDILKDAGEKEYVEKTYKEFSKS